MADTTPPARAGYVPPAIALRGITKRYAHVVANDRIDLTVQPGEIHALVGENGAGKSTLMKILTGVVQPDSGTISVNGQTFRFPSPAASIAAGIGMVYQHFRLVPAFTVTENIILGLEESGMIRRGHAASKVKALARQYGLTVDPHALVADLGVGARQRVEILKVLYRNARIIILDEPTAVLAPSEVGHFFDMVRKLRDGGATIILITHKLEEVIALCDSVTVLRGGRVIGVHRISDVDAATLAAEMIGGVMKPVTAADPPAQDGPPSPPVFSVRDLVTRSGGERPSVGPVSFDIRPGEILGIAGIEGNGQTELVDALMGLWRVASGTISVSGTDLTTASVKAHLRAGMAFIPEDRHRRGLVLDFTLHENLRLGRHFRGVRLPGGYGRRNVATLLQKFDVRPAEPALPAAHLSGGNQQKLVVARELTRQAKVIIASQPTRGVDIGAARFIHDQLRERRRQGAAILLVSSELAEVLELSDRVMVMYDGRFTFAGANRDLQPEDLGRAMTGSGNAPGVGSTADAEVHR